MSEVGLQDSVREEVEELVRFLFDQAPLLSGVNAPHNTRAHWISRLSRQWDMHVEQLGREGAAEGGTSTADRQLGFGYRYICKGAIYFSPEEEPAVEDLVDHALAVVESAQHTRTSDVAGRIAELERALESEPLDGELYFEVFGIAVAGLMLIPESARWQTPSTS